jgi:hypothetical protein
MPTTRDVIKRQAEHFKARQRVKAVHDAVAAEREFQDSKWGSIDEHGHTLGDWLHIAEAELAEAKLALIKGGKGRNSIRSEMIQTMAVLHAALEQHGVEDDHDGRHL